MPWLPSCHGGIGKFAPPEISPIVSRFPPLRQTLFMPKKSRRAAPSVFSCFVYNKASVVTLAEYYCTTEMGTKRSGAGVRLHFLDSDQDLGF